MENKLRLLYFSPTGTTKKIVNKIAEGLNLECIHHDITTVNSRRTELQVNSGDVLILGMPVYAGRIPELAFDFISKMNKGHNNSAIIVAVYGNRAYGDAIVEMYDLLKEKSFNPISAGVFIGEHSYEKEVAKNRPDQNDINIAIEYGVALKETIATYFKGIHFDLKIPGNRPYRERNQSLPIAPIFDNGRCMGCRECLKKCPTDAIRFKLNIVADEQLCIKCHSCVKVCPVQAVTFDSRLDHVRTWLIENFKDKRQEPEIFLPNFIEQEVLNESEY